ncbi:MAG: UvrB/UvrC motif-containing protein, partial [Victivallales bacterium]|nr:UvrB/UvrC motif-containing protein [Victivallales bacterium]
VILYADNITDSIQQLLKETEMRREKQHRYNLEHNITPRTIKRAVQASLRVEKRGDEAAAQAVGIADVEEFDFMEIERQLEGEMHAAAEALEFERAAQLRDRLFKLRRERKQ